MKPLPLFLTLLLALPLWASETKSIWTDPIIAARENPDFRIQGEYFTDHASHGVQVVALGNGAFDAYVFKGGLPGRGWEKGMEKIRITGARMGNEVIFETGSAKIREEKMTLRIQGASPVVLPRIERKSPTLGTQPPQGAVVLFDGSSADGWENGVIENGLLRANHSMSKQRFKSFRAHIEFRTPFQPHARGQKRGNSGIYHAGRWETQVLDSFGLEGKDNECGGIYSIAKPQLNMCLPPLSWQTYDVDFTAATFDSNGNRTSWPRITVKLNGVVIHDNLELSKDFTTAAPLKTPLTDEPWPMFLQDHKNPVYFRNIWVLPQ